MPICLAQTSHSVGRWLNSSVWPWIREALALGVPSIRARIDLVATCVRSELASIGGVTIHDRGKERSGLISFTIRDLDANEVKNRLATLGVAVGANGPAYTPFDMQARGLAGIVRASVSYLTSEGDIARLIEAVAGLAAEARSSASI